MVAHSPKWLAQSQTAVFWLGACYCSTPYMVGSRRAVPNGALGWWLGHATKRVARERPDAKTKDGAENSGTGTRADACVC